MKIVVGGRRSGKTFRMIQWFTEDPAHRVILVPNVQQRRFISDEIIKTYPEMGETARAWLGNIRLFDSRSNVGRANKKVWIDNVDMIIRSVAGYEGEITMSSSEEMDVEEI